LYAAHESAAMVEAVFVVELNRLEGDANVFGQGRVHDGVSDYSWV
jgi:hypothetical protein